MPLVTPNQGESLVLQNNVNKLAPQDLRLKLFTNNVTPGETVQAEVSASGESLSGFWKKNAGRCRA